jgi:hypothetical protein
MSRKKALAFVLVAALVLSTVAMFAGIGAATHGDTSGTVTDSADGAAIEGATVTFLNQSDGTEVANATTDVDGNYSVHLADGDYDVEVTADGYDTHAGVVTVAGATTADFSLSETVRNELHNSTYAVDEDDKEVYVDILNTSGDPVDVTFYGIDSDGNETQVSTETVSAASGEVVELNVTVDASTYVEYRVVVEADEGVSAEDITSGTLSKLGGGGGFSVDSIDFSAEYFGIPLWLHLVVGSSVIGVYAGVGDCSCLRLSLKGRPRTISMRSALVE